MYDNSALGNLVKYKLSNLFDELTINTSFKLLNLIHLYLIENRLWVRNKDIVVYANLDNTISFVLVTDINSLIITVNKNELIYLQNNVEVFDKLHNLLNWIYLNEVN